ncbi:BLOC-1-related complex subunit 7 isoform X1 [Panthera pardus]|uniref:BLOC-1-related complex subunit 7 n=1 Tax=Panthera pardus TaxID=9691 RepID=A0A9V1G4M0_PANPR|nr:BLOC-1-related complex subunit 7 isoform X1 [Panthera pardus]
MATGTPDSQARFGQSVKGLLTEKVNTCGTDVIALTKQVLKGSRSSELLGQAARNMVLQEDAILHSEDARSYSEEVSNPKAQVMISQLMRSSPSSGSALRACSLLGILPLCRSHTCIFTHSLSLSLKINLSILKKSFGCESLDCHVYVRTHRTVC